MNKTLIKRTQSAALLLGLFLAVSVCTPGSATTRVRTIQFKSDLVGITLPYHVVLPEDYDAPRNKTAGYPVLYLLHGLGGSYENWITKTRLVEYSALYHMIIVTPEGMDGWYTDSATVPAEKYETYVLQELIPDVERRFRAVKVRAGRSIAGLSMGGYGALKFAAKHSDMFIFAASMSGALDPTQRTETNKGFAWGFIRPSIQKAFGPDESPARAVNDLHRLFRELPADRIKSLPFLYLDCGTEDGFVTTNRELAAILLARKIPHEFRQVPGTHDWAYWDKQVREVLKIAAERMPANYFVAPTKRHNVF